MSVFWPGGAGLAATGVPKILSHQGRLLDSGGNLLGGAGTQYCFKFSFFDNATVGLGTQLWPAGAPSTMTVAVKNGVYNIGIGDVAAGGDPLTFDFQSTDTTFLNIQVAAKVGATCAPGDGAEVFENLSPRQPVYASGYSINSDTVDGFHAAQAATGSQVAALTGGSLVLGDVNPQINVTGANTLTLQGGAGTGDVQFFSAANKLTSAGNLTVAGTSASGGGFIASGAAVDLSSGINEDLTLDANGTGSLVLVGYDCSGNVNGGKLTANAAGVVTCADDISGGAPEWDTIAAPLGDLSLAMGANTSTFIFGAATGASDLFTFIDTAGNTGGGHIVDVETAAGSSASPFRVAAAGTTLIDTSANGLLTLGTIAGASPLVLEGATVDVNQTSITVSDPTAARTITLPDASGTFAVSASGNIALSASGDVSFTGALPVANGGTGDITAAGARTNLGLVIGTDVLAPNGDGSGLTSLTAANIAAGTAGIDISGNAATVTNGIYTTGSYADPSWLASLAGSKISGNISGNAANVTGTVAVGNGGTGNTVYTTGQFVAYDGSNLVSSGYDNTSFAAAVHTHAILSQGTGITPFSYNGGTAQTVAIADTAVSPGSYGSPTQVATFTVDQQGRLTAAANATISGVAPGGAAGGDLSGTYPDPTVSRINGALLGATAATAGHLLIADGSQWASAAVSGDATLASTGVITLKNTGSAGVYGSAASVPVLTTDAQGRVTAVVDTAIALDASQIASGTLSVSRGGTGLSTFSTGDLIFASAANTLSALTAGGAGQVLKISGGVPAWGTDNNTTYSAGTGLLLVGTTFSVDPSAINLPDLAGVLTIAQGGTNATSANYTAGKFLAYDGTRISSTVYDQTSFLVSEADTLATVTGRGATTSTPSSFLGGLAASGAAVELNVSSNFPTNINTGTSTGAVSIGNGAAGPLALVSGAASSLNVSSAALTITAGAASTWSTSAGDLTLQGGSGTVSLGSSSNLTSAAALAIATGAGNVVLQPAGSGTTANVQIGAGGGGSATPDLLALDVKSNAGDPAGVNGQTYYNAAAGKFRCFESGAWRNCIPTQDFALSSLTAAVAANSINNGDNPQTWNWSLATADQVGMAFEENSASTAGGAPAIVTAQTQTGSTAMPLYVKNLGNAASFRVDDQAADTTPFLVSQNGNVAIGAESFDPIDPEMLKVEGGTGSSTNIISGYGDLNSFLQLNIHNRNAGGSASSDIVATADNGNDTVNYIDVGINSSGYNDPAYTIGGPDDGYLYTNGQNLAIGTQTAGKSLLFHTGGTLASNERMRIDGSGNVGINTTSPGSALDVKGVIRISGGTSGYVGFAAAAAAGSTTYVLPTVDGSSGYALTTDGAGTLSWTSVTGHFQRVGTTLSPLIAGDDITTSGNIYTSGTGAITSAGLLTGSAGLTVTGAAVSLNDSSNFAVNIATGSSTGSVSIGNGAAGAVSITSGSGLTFAGGAASSFNTTAGDITLQPAGSGTTANVQIGAGGAGSSTPDLLVVDVKSDNISDPAGTNGAIYYNAVSKAFRCFIFGSWSNCDTTGGTATLQSAYNAGATITTSASTDIALTLTSGNLTASGAGSVLLTPTGASSFTSGGALTLTGGAASTWGTSAGNLSLQAAGPGTTAAVQIGAGGTGSTTPDLLVVDVKDNSSSTDPAGTDGAMYYNMYFDKFRCYEAGGWKDCDTGTAPATVTLQQAYNTGATITTAASTDVALTLTSGNFTASGAGSVLLTPTGASSFTSGAALTLTGGAASVWSTSTGALTVDSAAALDLGTTNATAVSIGRTGVTTTNNGALTSTQTLTASNGLTLTTGALNLAATSGALALSGLGASSVSTGANSLALTGSPIQINASGSGTTTIGSATAAVNLPGLTASQVVFTDATDNLTSAGTVGIGQGGTGQTSKTTAYDALSPSTTKGDLTVYNGTDNVRLPVGGTNGFVLTVDSTQGTGMKWAALPGSSLQSAYNGGSTITTSGSTDIALTLTSGNFTASGAGSVLLTPTGASSFTSGAALTLTGGAASTWGTSAGNLSLQAAGAGTTAAVQIGTGGAGSTTPDLLAFDVKSDIGDPAGFNGATYYNGFWNRFRCFEQGVWVDCGANAPSTTSLQDAYFNGPAITTAASTDIALTLTSGNLTASGAGSVLLTPTGASSFTSGAALTLTGGASSVWSTSVGSLTVDSAAALNIGTVNAVSVSIGRTGVTTTNNGALTSTQTLTAANGFAVSAGNVSLSSGNITGASPFVFDGVTADVNKTVLAVADPTAGRTITLPNASGTVAVSATGPITLSSAGSIDCPTCLVSAGILFTLAGSSGINQTLHQGDTLLVAAGSNIATTGSATDMVTVDVVSNPTFSGLVTGQAGLTVTGAAVSLNSNSNFPVNIANGTSTGAVAIGGGANTVAVASSNWGVSSAGALSGLTGFTQSAGAFAADLTGANSAVFASTAANTDSLAIKPQTATAAASFTGTLTSADLTAARIWAFPDAGGTVAVSASGNIALSAAGNITFNGTLPVGSGGTGVASTPANGQLPIGNGSGYTLATITPGSGVGVANAAGSITISNSGVLSVGASGVLSSSGGQNPSVTFTGTLPVANGGTNSSTALGSGKLMVSSAGAIVESAAQLNGVLPIGNGTGYTFATLTAGAGISVTNAAGSISIANTGVLAEADTLASVTGRGNATTTTISDYGETVTSGTATDDQILLSVTTGGALRFNGTITNTDLTAARTYTLPDATGTFAVSAASPLSLNATTGALTLGTVGVANGGTGLTATPTNGQLLIGNGSGFTLATLTAGTGIGVTNAAGSITISNLFPTPRLDQILAAAATNTLANANFAQTWNWGTLTTQTGLTLGGGSAMTTGSVLALGSGTFVHTIAETGSLASLTFADASTNASGASVTNGLVINSTVNTSGAGTKTISGLSVAAPTLTGCTGGACVWRGLNVTMGPTTSGITQSGLAIATAGTDRAIFVMDASGNPLFDVRDMSSADNQFGAAATAGAFISRNSMFDEDFGVYQAATTNAAVQVRGGTGKNAGTFSANFFNNGGGGSNQAVSLAALNGIERIQAVSGNAIGRIQTALEYLSTDTSAVIMPLYAAANLPVIIMKAQPSATGANNRVVLGLGDTGAPSATNIIPNNGIFFSNCYYVGATLTCDSNWHGVVNIASVSSKVDCPAVDTAHFAYMRIEVRGTSDAHFFIDTNTSDGINTTECGTGVTATPSAAMTATLEASSYSPTAATNTTNLDVDYFRSWQDDSVNSIATVAETTGLTADASGAALADADLIAALVAQLASRPADQAPVDFSVDRLAAGLSVVAPQGVFDGLTVNSIGSLGDALSLNSDMIFIGRPYFNSDSAGFAVVERGDSSVRVDFARTYESQPIVSASYSLQDGDEVPTETTEQLVFGEDIRFRITQKTTGGFTIKLNRQAPVPLRFSWVAVAVKDARTVRSAKPIAPPAPAAPVPATEPAEPPAPAETVEPPAPPADAATPPPADTDQVQPPADSDQVQPPATAEAADPPAPAETVEPPAPPADISTPPPADSGTPDTGVPVVDSSPTAQ